MLRGRGSERRPSWASHWKVRICGSPRMAGRSACVGTPPPRAPATKRGAGPRGRAVSVFMERAIRRRLAPDVGNGRLWVVRRPLRDGRYAPSGSGATDKGMGPAADCCVRRKGGPSVALVRHQEGATPGSPWLPLRERAAPDGSTRGDDEGQEHSPANIASWCVATNEARPGDGRGPPDEGRVRREEGQASAQPGRRAVLGGIGAPPRFSERPEGGCGTRPAGMVLQRVRTAQGRVVDAADGPQPPLVASLLPLAMRAGAPAFAGLAGIRKGTLTARPDRQAVGVPSMIPPLLGFVRGGTAPPIRASLP
jgi:hypothetical protein